MANKRDIKAALGTFFEENKIEFYSVLPYGACRVTAEHIIAREDFLPRSVIFFLLPYYGGATDNLSVYAASKDYHVIIRELTDGLISRLKELCPEARAKGYGDHSPIDERHGAISAGLGILGKSGLLINEKYGTYVFIADVITDISPEELGAMDPVPLRLCHGCGKCLAACPTGVLRGESDRCLSEITQRKGELTDSETALMRDNGTVWGCDLCQSACPYNINPIETPIAFFHEDRIPRLTMDILAQMDKKALSMRAFGWRGRRVVERNLKLLGY